MTQSEVNQGAEVKLTQAEQFARAIETEDEDDAAEQLRVTADFHHTSQDECDSVLEFPDGSLYDESDNTSYESKGQYLDDISAANECAAELTDAVEDAVTLTGVVEPNDCWSPCIDLPFKLTQIRLSDGTPYLRGSSDHNEEPNDEASIAYTHELAGLVGRRIVVRCRPDKYREERATTRGNPITCPMDIAEPSHP